MSDLGFDFKKFRAMFRPTLRDWVKSLFRDRLPFEPCRIYHSWRHVHECPFWEYLQCDDCMERKWRDNVRCMSGYRERLNIEWLNYEEIEFEPKRIGPWVSWS